jgi:hypothetical protein
LEALKKEGNVLKEALEKSNQVASACILSRLVVSASERARRI